MTSLSVANGLLLTSLSVANGLLLTSGVEFSSSTCFGCHEKDTKYVVACFVGGGGQAGAGDARAGGGGGGEGYSGLVSGFSLKRWRWP